MASAGNSTVDTTGENVFDSSTDGGKCTTFMVKCKNGSSNPALVNIPGLHKSGEFFPVEVGDLFIFRVNHNGIGTVFVKGSGGDADINFGVVAKTRLS